MFAENYSKPLGIHFFLPSLDFKNHQPQNRMIFPQALVKLQWVCPFPYQGSLMIAAPEDPKGRG